MRRTRPLCLLLLLATTCQRTPPPPACPATDCPAPRRFPDVAAWQEPILIAWFDDRARQRADEPHDPIDAELRPAWMGKDGTHVPAPEFWETANWGIYLLKSDSTAGPCVAAMPWVDEDAVAKGWTCVEVSTEDGQRGVLPTWSELWFDSDRKLRGVNLTGGSACPFVAVSIDGGDFVEHGEILRNLRAPALEATQSLAIPAAGSCRRVTVRLLERKPETTHLDRVALEIGGRRIAPSDCGARPICEDDARYLTLGPGDAIDVNFDLQAGSDCSQLRVIADGYYVPHRDATGY